METKIMEKFYICAFKDNTGYIYAALNCRSDFKEDIENHFNLKYNILHKAENAPDKVLKIITADDCIIKRENFSLVMRMLRNFDEVGICNEIHDIFEEIINDKSISFVAFGKKWEGCNLNSVSYRIARLDGIII
jgi:hypothetical protein